MDVGRSVFCFCCLCAFVSSWCLGVCGRLGTDSGKNLRCGDGNWTGTFPVIRQPSIPRRICEFASILFGGARQFIYRHSLLQRLLVVSSLLFRTFATTTILVFVYLLIPLFDVYVYKLLL